MALYTKYRPTKFVDIKEQFVITDILKSAIMSGKVSHAYIFTGTRGTGKTTTARIFAKAINCLKPKEGEPCNKCDVCKSFDEKRNIDLIEIDAASNRGIDDIREIRDKVNFAPTMSKYKVYIIDEVHMLTKDAFNALLKTLEEPPSFVVFILATTEIYKVPLTILSRCQRFDFKNASQKEVLELLEDVAKKEKINISKDVLELVAEVGEGSFRDSLSIFEKLISITDELTYDKALSILGIPDQKRILNILEFITHGEKDKALLEYKDGVSNGVDSAQFSKNVLKIMEKKLVAQAMGENTDFKLSEILSIIKEFLSVEEKLKYATSSNIVVETAIVSLSITFSKVPVIEEKIVRSKPTANDIVIKEIKKEPAINTKDKRIKNDDVKDVKIEEPVEATAAKNSEDVDEIIHKWGEIVSKIMPINHHLGSFLSRSLPVRIDDKFLYIQVKYSFYKDRIEEVKSRDLIANIFNEVLGLKLFLKCEINTKLEANALVRNSHQPVNAGFEKKEQIGDNIKENISLTVDEEPDILKEAMKIFELE